MKHFVGVLAASAIAAVVLGSSSASADILAATTNPNVFDSTSTVEVLIPIGALGGKSLKFKTAAVNTRVKITYNANCLISGTRGRYVAIRVLVDDVEAKPFDVGDFPLCSAVDAAGQTWVGATRQVLFIVPSAGDHVVKVVGRAVPSGNWSLDNTSLFVEK
jgi:hypothetical protein